MAKTFWPVTNTAHSEFNSIITKKADTSQPRIISEVGNNPTAMHELEPPPDHKGVVTAITIVFAFIFAVAGVFIGMELNELNGLLSDQFLLPRMAFKDRCIFHNKAFISELSVFSNASIE